MKVLTGHLTNSDKKAIKEGLVSIPTGAVLSFKSGRAYYYITEQNGTFTVKKQIKDRGMIPCPGSELRLSTYTSTFTL